MAVCAACGKKLTVFNKGNDERCTDCLSGRGPKSADYSDESVQERLARAEAEKERIEEHECKINSVMLTTETYPEGLKITKRIEVVTAECAFGMNIFKDLFAGVRDIVGGRSKAVQKTLQDTRRTALYELKKEAYEVGANAVVGVDLDYVELSAAGSMVLLVASGTAVRIEEN